MSNLRLLPPRHQLDAWVSAVRHSHDLQYLDVDAATFPATIVTLPTHCRITLDGNDVSAWVSWSAPTIQLVDQHNRVAEVPWRIQAAGKTQAEGVCTITFDPDQPRISGLPANAGDQFECITVFSKRRLLAFTKRVATAGLQAEFEAVQALQPYVEDAVHRRNARVAFEVHGEHPIFGDGTNHKPVVLDALREEEVVTEICLGTVGQQNSALVFRALRQAANTDVLAQVPIHKYLCDRIDPACETAIRRMIGDPHVGRKIRREFIRWRDQHPQFDGDDPVAAFVDHWNGQARKSSERIGRRSVTNALTADSDALVDRVSCDELANAGVLLARTDLPDDLGRS